MLDLPVEDPNRDSTDPMISEYWLLGEGVQDRILAAGYESPTVEGIAVDLHDILQAADRIREEFGTDVIAANPDELISKLRRLQNELLHIRWHCASGELFLGQSIGSIEASHPTTP